MRIGYTVHVQMHHTPIDAKKRTLLMKWLKYNFFNVNIYSTQSASPKVSVPLHFFPGYGHVHTTQVPTDTYSK